MLRTVSALVALICIGIVAANAREPVLLSAPATATDADRALVLVHGLMGSPLQSFGKIPQLVGSDTSPLPGHGKMSDLAVYAVDYEADFSSRGSLEDVARGVADDLAASEIFRRHRHVVFVTHSMGGLVLKRTLALWLLQRKTVLLDRILGVGMLGVPSQGAPLAKLVAGGHVGDVATLLGWNGGLVKDLSTDEGERYLSALETDWMAVKALREGGSIRKWTPLVLCGFETKPESRVLELALGSEYGTIVPRLFTSSACDETRPFSVSHIQLPKPEDEKAPVYVWLRDLIRRSIASGLQEQRDELTTAPTAMLSFMTTKVELSNDELEPASLDRATGLPREPERIDFADGKSRELAAKLVLRGGPFHGSTKSDLYEAVSKRNTCVHVVFSTNRMVITLAVEGETKSCRDGQAIVCGNQSCD